MYTDPKVVRRKVERELTDFVDRIDQFRARGIWILEYRFPSLLVAFAAPRLKPYPATPYGVLVNLSNYDVEPPSLKFVNPFTSEPLKKKEIPTELQRLRVLPAEQQPLAAGNGVIAQAPNGQPVQHVQQERLLQWWSDDDYPFVCLQGVREYHDNPAHTGDPWWLYRGKGAGGIIRLLEVVSKYGTEAMRQVNFQLQFNAAGIVHQEVLDQS